MEEPFAKSWMAGEVFASLISLEQAARPAGQRRFGLCKRSNSNSRRDFRIVDIKDHPVRSLLPCPCDLGIGFSFDSNDRVDVASELCVMWLHQVSSNRGDSPVALRVPTKANVSDAVCSPINMRSWLTRPVSIWLPPAPHTPYWTKFWTKF
jgi:hypothetical protein